MSNNYMQGVTKRPINFLDDGSYSVLARFFVILPAMGIIDAPSDGPYRYLLPRPYRWPLVRPYSRLL